MSKVKSITTKVGDQGTTRLFSGEEVLKNSPRLEAYGDMDELVAVLGVARFHAQKKEVKDALLDIQRALFVVASELATTPKKLEKLPHRVDEAMLNQLDEKRSALEARTDIPGGFVIPGSSLATSHVEHARTIARRCERKVVTLLEKNIIENKVLLVWFNRLSDYLYLLARHEEDGPTLA